MAADQSALSTGSFLPLRWVVVSTLAVALMAALAGDLGAQEGGEGRGGRRGNRRPTAEEIEAWRARQGGGGPPAAQAGPSAEPAKPAEEPAKEGAEAEKKEGEEKPKEEPANTIKRPTEPPKADAAELEVAPDADGMVQFSFRGQPWTEVLEWFAGVAGYSLDWQELPADFLNLSTQRRHTIAETRDLLNRHLLARGFTMILQGDVLTVVKTEKIDPSLVPRVDPDELDDHPPHDFVRTRFPLPESMDPAKAVEDLKVVLSPAAKVTPLLASKQLQVIDAVANLRDARDLIYSEQLAESQDVRPRSFAVRYRRADYIADQVMIVLGLDPGSRKTPMELQLEQQRMQLMMQMQQQGKDVSTMLRKDGPQVFVAVDKRRNVVLVNAPPKEMEIIERTVKEFDVPENGLAAAPGSEGGPVEGADDRRLTLKRHPTTNVDADAVVTALKEMGDLDPLTQLQSDAESKTIFAFATEADHATIETMIQKLDDGTARSLHVVYLNRRTPADQIAGTITALMVGDQQAEERRPPWMEWDFGRRNRQGDNRFRVQADVENNRLLLWANNDEFEEVSIMLKDLGALAAGNGGNPNRIRMLDARSPAETAELLERLKATWSGSNELKINLPPATDAAAPTDQQPTSPPAGEATRDKVTGSDSTGPFHFAQHTGLAATGESFVLTAQPVEQAEEPAQVAEPTAAPQAEAAPTPQAEAAPAPQAEANPTNPTNPAQPAQADPAAAAPAKSAPVNITVTPDGRIILSSEDVAALDQMEDLLQELEPPQREFEIFQLKNSRASMVSLNLEEYFADELAEDDMGFGRWWGNAAQQDEPATLGNRRKLRFIWDSDTNTIVVQNGSPAQLAVIRKLIEIYDQPLSEDAVDQRRTDIVPIRYSQAQDIATAIKDVYRDLLSSRDKEFQRGNNDQRERGSRIGQSSLWSSSSSQRSGLVQVSFEGALSIGVDEVSNSLIISADAEIWENVRELAESLDEKAKPNSVVQIHRVGSSIDAEGLKDALETAISQPWPGGKPSQGGRMGGFGGRGEWRGRNRD